MNYTASISDFFKSPKWGMNLLLGAVCLLIPFVGTIVLSGWHITGFWARKDRDPAKFPDFDFSFFGKYLERGLWPFVVSLVISILIVPVALVIFMALMAGGLFSIPGTVPHQDPNEAVVALLVLGGIVLYVLFLCAFMVVQVPLLLAATITQEFAPAFNFSFLKRFLGLVWLDVILAGFFMVFASLLLGVAGMLACYVGIFFTMPLTLFGWHHLQRQLYDLYLSRGGEPLLFSPKLADGPPALPTA